ncbi:MAG: hypothetical protein AVDCRST_MAG42-221 [uncultured Chthoniobacterales bacterium]|uniref:DUF2029 domain-containing protein n=1 Tax=uncultured Chthoniobacterales bacterium TaxID=1836801 RepID=A0A6J4H3L4_9BACT|nr:MAG: hypothetical protein AVDCRST_MAG42-221 [uncultured Chthoniobacterales bacterium]
MNASDARRRLPRFIDRLNTDAAFRVLLWLFAAAVIVYAGIPVANALRGESIKDYELWHDTGQRVLKGEQIYPAVSKKFPFMYPPPCAIFLAPISLVGQTGVVVIGGLVNAAAWLASILLSVRLATGQWRRQHVLVYLVPTFVISVYAWSNFHLGQPSLILLALMLGAFVALQNNRAIAAGALIGVATAIKAFPVIAIVYLVYRRYWVAAASLAATIVLLFIVLPMPVRGFAQAQTDLQRWTAGMLFKYDDSGMAQRPRRSNSWKNQSIWGVANRLLRRVDADDQHAAHVPLYVNVADLAFPTVNKLILAAALALGLTYVAVMPRRRSLTPESFAIEAALLLLLVLLFTPLVFGYLFAWLLFPLAVIVHRLMTRPHRALLICALAALALLALTIPFQRTAQAYGNTFFATLLLFVGLAIELSRMKREREGGVATDTRQREAVASLA